MGKWVLGGENDYTGDTIITNGELELSSTGSFNNSLNIKLTTATANLDVSSVRASACKVDKPCRALALFTALCRSARTPLFRRAIVRERSPTWVWPPFRPGRSQGTYKWEINDALGTAGTNWDLINLQNLLDVTASTGSNRFMIDIYGLNAGNSVELCRTSLPRRATNG